MKEQVLSVVEVFYSLQGEGNASGYPFIFIRLAGCNLRCGYCDTGYSFDRGREISLNALLDEIKALPAAKRVLITGGEPLLQKEGVIALTRALISFGKTVYLETNGSLSLEGLPDAMIKIVDIKTPGSGFKDSFLFANLKFLKPQDELKMVICHEEDLDFAENLVIQYRLPDLCTVHFSPVAGGIPPRKVALRILEKNLEVKLTLQLHKIIGVQ